jgi:hypothetical protein
VTAAGRVKVLDFGLAKLTEPAPSEATATQETATAMAAITTEGKILGTAACMSPEQAEGSVVARCLAKDPDRRYQAALDVRNELKVS